MRLARETLNAKGLARGIHRRLQMHDVPLAKFLFCALQREDLTSCQLRLQRQHAVRAMVSSSDADTLWVQETVEGVQGREARGVGQAGRVEEGCQDGFEACACRGCFAGVDVGIEWLGSLWIGWEIRGDGDESYLRSRGLGAKTMRGILAGLLRGRDHQDWRCSGRWWRCGVRERRRWSGLVGRRRVWRVWRDVGLTKWRMEEVAQSVIQRSRHWRK